MFIRSLVILTVESNIKSKLENKIKKLKQRKVTIEKEVDAITKEKLNKRKELNKTKKEIEKLKNKIMEFDEKNGWDKTSVNQLIDFIQEEINNLKSSTNDKQRRRQ